MPRKIIIIGGNAAGTDAAVSARKLDREAEISLISKENTGAYSRCGLPFVLGGQIPKFDNLVVYPPSFYRMMKFNLKLETTVTNIDTKSKTVNIEDKKGVSESIQYDSLILSTGSYPFKPPIQGIEKEGVFSLWSIEDGKKLLEAMKGAKNAVVIGSGLIGLEVAVAFLENGIKTVVVEMLPQILPRLLDQDVAKDVQEKFEEKGIEIILGNAAKSINGEKNVKSVTVAGKDIPTDIVLNAAGVRPNTELAQKSGIVIGETGGIKTDIRMQTSIKDVYAAGDCAETTHMITHKSILPLLGSTAVREGNVAGINAAGGYSLYPGSLCSAVSQLLDFQVGATGLTEFLASRFGVEVVVGKMSGHTKATYYPGALDIKVKLLVEKETKRIVGGQIIGGEEVTQRINALSLAIQKQMTVYELIKADTCYAPSVCETWEPVVLAAEMATRKL